MNEKYSVYETILMHIVYITYYNYRIYNQNDFKTRGNKIIFIFGSSSNNFSNGSQSNTKITNNTSIKSMINNRQLHYLL